jgi:RNA polymerase I-specific transcription initiation factor RRN3
LFRYIETQGKESVGARALYREILPVFESSILTTYKSKFVQYCIFLLCGLEADAIAEEEQGSGAPISYHHAVLHRSFAAKLIDIFVDPYRATLTRRSGACYLASFISRSYYVSPETVCETVSALLRWAEAYMISLGVNAIRSADSRTQSEHHALFYTVCQAAFYIMCFHGVEAMRCHQSAVEYHSSPSLPEDSNMWEMPHPEEIDIDSKRWTVICGHELQPLRFCLESVRDEFLHVAHALNLIEERTLDQLSMDAKRWSTGRTGRRKASKIVSIATPSSQRQNGGVGGLGRGSNPLNSFFPFDPLLLRRSHEFIDPFYKNWGGSIEDEEDDNDDDIDEEDPVAEDEVSLASSTQEDIEEDDIEEDEKDDESTVASESIQSSSVVHPMSLASTYGEQMLGSYDAATKREEQKDVWNEATARHRSQSVDGEGSW